MSHQPGDSSEQRAEPPASGITNPDAERGNGISTRPLLLGVGAIVFIIVVAVVLLQVFVVQRTPELTEERLETAQDRWEQHGPDSYNIDLEIRGAQPGSVHLEVRDGVVTVMTRDGRQPPERTWSVWSVPGQFETLERELVLAEDPQHEMDVAAGTRLQLRCEFDSELGFPRRYHRYATGNAPEVFWRVTRFEPR